VATYYPILLFLTVLSWIAVPFVNHLLTNLRDRRLAYNENLERLESIFSEMNEAAKEYFGSDKMSLDDYYQMLSFNERIKFVLKANADIDKNYSFPNSLVIQMRKVTTDDDYREKNRLHGMRELIAIQTRFLDSAPRKVRWF
jgi:hypothetical protein